MYYGRVYPSWGWYYWGCIIPMYTSELMILYEDIDEITGCLDISVVDGENGLSSSWIRHYSNQICKVNQYKLLVNEVIYDITT